jgi:hypothetical protein
MAKEVANDDRVGRVRLVLELCSRPSGNDVLWSVVASLPGRESEARYRWRGKDGRVDDGQLEDIQATIGSLVAACVLLIDGAQQQLPGVKV